MVKETRSFFVYSITQHITSLFSPFIHTLAQRAFCNQPKREGEVVYLNTWFKQSRIEPVPRVLFLSFFSLALDSYPSTVYHQRR